MKFDIEFIKKVVEDHIYSTVNYHATIEEFQLVRVCIVGSHARGNATPGCDIDVAIEYTGTLREDDVFNSLMENKLYLDDTLIDFIPYHLDKGNRINEECIELWPEKPITFEPEKMKKLVEKDLYLSFVFKDLSRRNPHLVETEVLKILFNGEVLDDFAMQEEYRSI